MPETLAKPRKSCACCGGNNTIFAQTEYAPAAAAVWPGSPEPHPAGPHVHLVEPGNGHSHSHGESHQGLEESFSWTWRIIVPGALFVAGLIGREWIADSFSVYAFYAVMLGAYLLCGLPVLREAGEAIIHKDFFNEFTLMSLATIVAIFLGEMSEAVGVMLFYSLGEAAQVRAAGRSRGSIKALLASKPETAHVLANGAIVDVRPETVPVGSTVVVKPGDKVPLDGSIVSGASMMDMSSLTGESTPVSAGPGDKAFSGSIALDGDLTIVTTAGYSNSTVGRILALVEKAVAAKSKTERFITVFARYYTPAVVAAAALVAILPPLVAGADWNTWIYRALVLLVVSCPCALVLSIPLAFFGGIGAASRHGLLVKGGQVFDALVKARAIVFDKTGTLTQGKLTVKEIEPADGVDERDLLRLAALGESKSSHPMAKAVLAAAHAEKLALDSDVTTKNEAGKGIVAQSKEGEILIGNARLLTDHGVRFVLPATGDTLVLVALNGEFQGGIHLSDHLKTDTVQALADLRADGIEKLYMLTGDRPEAAAKVAEELALDGYRAGLLPEDKVNAFRALSPHGDAVFVGDGVNDAPVLATAGVGVAMGALGSGAAVEAADAVILDDSPARLPLLIRIAKKTRRVAAENIAFALAVKIGFMALGVIGVSGLWEAVFADVGVALLAVLNSMRMTRV